MAPSAFHEILIALFRERPALVQSLLAPWLRDELPAGEVTVADGSFTQLAPAEFTADLVLLIDGPPRLGVVVEVQLRRDEDKRYSWPLYAAALRARHRCPVVLLILAPDASVATWAATPVSLGPGNLFRTYAVGPSAIPWVTTEDAARAMPEAAVLSALAHGDEPDGRPVLEALLAGLSVLPDETARLYHDLVMSRLSATTRQALEELMKKGNYEYLSDFARQHYGEGLTEGKALGVAEGLAEGLAEGQHQGVRRLVLRLLARRFGLPGQALQARVEVLPLERLEALAEALLDFASLDELETWLDGGTQAC